MLRVQRLYDSRHDFVLAYENDHEKHEDEPTAEHDPESNLVARFAYGAVETVEHDCEADPSELVKDELQDVELFLSREFLLHLTHERTSIVRSLEMVEFDGFTESRTTETVQRCLPGEAALSTLEMYV